MSLDPSLSVRTVTYESLLHLAEGYRTVVLGGYSSLGYKNPAALSDLIRVLVRECGENTFYISGATAAGIGMAYRLIPSFATEFGIGGIRTAGIVSRNATLAEIEPQDYVVLVDTLPGDWRVMHRGESLMVRIAASTGGNMIYFGGGAIAESEIAEAASKGLPVTIVEGPEVQPGRGNAARLCATIEGVSRWHRGMDCPMLAK